jgi:outer membrane protein W
MSVGLSLLFAITVHTSEGNVSRPPDHEASHGSAIESSEAEPAWNGFSFRVGALFLAPLGRSRELELLTVEGPAQLSVRNGPIAGSFVTMGHNVMPAVTLGYAFPFFNRQLSLETILALPFVMQMYAGGTLSDQSLAPTALGNVPTGVPALGRQLGEVRVLPPVVTAVYRFFPQWRVRPYLGLGASFLIPLEAKITNPVLTEVTTPTLRVPTKLGAVFQGGIEARLWKWFFVTADLKFIAGFDLEAQVTNVWVKTPSLPLFEAVQVGDTAARIAVNPLVVQLGVGMNL